MLLVHFFFLNKPSNFSPHWKLHNPTDPNVPLYNENKIKNALEFLSCGSPQRQHKCFQIAIVWIDCSLNSEYNPPYWGKKLPEVAFELSYS